MRDAVAECPKLIYTAWGLLRCSYIAENMVIFVDFQFASIKIGSQGFSCAK